MGWHLVVDGTAERCDLLNLPSRSSSLTFADNDGGALDFASLVRGVGNLGGDNQLIDWLTELGTSRECASNAGNSRLAEGRGGGNASRCASCAEDGSGQHP